MPKTEIVVGAHAQKFSPSSISHVGALRGNIRRFGLEQTGFLNFLNGSA